MVKIPYAYLFILTEFWFYFPNEKMAKGKHEPGRLAAILVSLAVYVISLVFNGLSAVGVGKLTSSLTAELGTDSLSKGSQSFFLLPRVYFLVSDTWFALCF